MLPSVSASLRLNEPVNRIEYSYTGVTVRTSKARYNADQVIVTTPLSVLQSAPGKVLRDSTMRRRPRRMEEGTHALHPQRDGPDATGPT